MNIFTLTILFPLLSFIILAISQGKWSENISALIGISGVGLSALITAYLIFNVYYYDYNYITFIYLQELWSWFKIDQLHVKMMFRLDGLSLVMLSIITGIGFIIHIYAVWYMSGNEGYSRFFAYTNLFISNMILLVLSDNLLLIYFGWEGVGLCSYLLIGFYYFDVKNGLESLKAFIMTRFGDICLMCALFMIYDQYHTLSLNELFKLDPQCLFNNMSNWISIMLLIGSIGKSAQLPLHTWLVSAMVGPTPVSALIHAATMVTSGVYLINRMHNFFLITPFILYIAGIIGAITLVVSGCSALFQNNIKKILAYSTISQIGYMFLALGEKNWIGSIFHLTTHAVFKALLFLAAGSLIHACQNEQNIFKIGRLYKSMPIIYICFIIGGASLSGLPIITSGFYSKELILLHTFANNNYLFLFSILIGSFLTSFYTFRMIFIVFHGKQIINFKINYNIYQYFPLIILSLLSTFIGKKIQLSLINTIINSNDSYHIYNYNQIYLILTSEILMFLGMWIASLFWLNFTSKITHPIVIRRPLERITRCLILLCHYGWGIDWLYKIIFIRSYLFITKKLSRYNDPVEVCINGFILLFNWFGRNLMCIENGKLNWYVISMNIGSVIILLITFINIKI